MNTQLTFYITGLVDREFVKNIYTCITDQEISDSCDVHDFIDDNIRDIMDTADISFVIDHVVLYFKPTKKTATEIILLKSVHGVLTFPEKRKSRKLTGKVVEVEKVTQEVVAPIQTKDYHSCWIQPNGKVIYVGFACHEEWAIEYLLEREGDDEYWEMKHTKHNYAYEILESEGWIRILGWTDPPTFSLPNHITPKQRQAVKEYCQTEGCDLPKELN